MGTWGTGVFEDDTTCDLIYRVMGGEAKPFIQDVVSVEINNNDYLEDWGGYDYIIAGVILDSLLHKNFHNCPVEGFEEWLEAQSPDSIIEFLPAVIRGLKHTLSENSELTEIWQDNEKDYPEWKSNVEKIIASLDR